MQLIYFNHTFSVFPAYAMLRSSARLLTGRRVASSRVYSTKRLSIWHGSENVLEEKFDQFNDLSADAYAKDRARLNAWVGIGNIEDSIKKSGKFPQGKIDELVDLYNAAEDMSKGIRHINGQKDHLYDPNKRILKLQKDQERITSLIVTTLQREAASQKKAALNFNGLQRSFDSIANVEYLHSLKDRLAYVVNEQRRLEKLLK